MDIRVASIFQLLLIALLLVLGTIFYIYIAENGAVGVSGDETFSFIAAQESMPMLMSALLVLGVVAATFSSTGGSLTALTTSFSVDILRIKQSFTKGQGRRVNNIVHLLVAVTMVALIFLFDWWNNDSAIELFYLLSSYTYGPLLGMFAFGVVSKRKVRDNLVPLVAIIAPLMCFVVDHNSERWLGGYQFGFEILLLNAALTIGGLYCISKK